MSRANSKGTSKPAKLLREDEAVFSPLVLRYANYRLRGGQSIVSTQVSASSAWNMSEYLHVLAALLIDRISAYSPRAAQDWAKALEPPLFRRPVTVGEALSGQPIRAYLQPEPLPPEAPAVAVDAEGVLVLIHNLVVRASAQNEGGVAPLACDWYLLGVLMGQFLTTAQIRLDEVQLSTGQRVHRGGATSGQRRRLKARSMKTTCLGIARAIRDVHPGLSKRAIASMIRERLDNNSWGNREQELPSERTIYRYLEKL